MDNENIINKIKDKYPKLFIKYIVDNDLKIPPEKDDGFIEYKRNLDDCEGKKFNKYATQMRWRISENIKFNIAIYYIGVDDDGSIVGLSNNAVLLSTDKIIELATSIDASIKEIQLINIDSKYILKIILKNKKLINNFLVEFINI